MNNRKLILLCLSLIWVGISRATEISFLIKGHIISKLGVKKIILQDYENYLHQEIELNANNDFSCTGILKQPGPIMINTENTISYGIWVSEGTITIEIEEYDLNAEGIGRKYLKINNITGPPETVKHESFIKHWNSLSNKFSQYQGQERQDSITKNFLPDLEDYISKHPGSDFNTFEIGMFLLTNEQKAKLYQLSARVLTPYETERIKTDLARQQLLITGNKIENFSQPDPGGKLFSTTSISKKIVLLEFWASNCAPCRANNPELKLVYGEYKSKGFEIVGISLDDDKKKWNDAIKKDRLPWIQVSDLKGWNNEIAAKYFINAIPFNILIDYDRKIIDTNLSTEQLRSILRGVLK